MAEQNEFSRKLADAKDKGIRTVDLQFIDIFGNIKFKTVSFDEFLHEKEYLKGYSVDGSSINGYGVPVEESDLIVMPDPKTLRVLPWAKDVSRVICDVHCPPVKGEEQVFEGDSRSALKGVIASIPEALSECGARPAGPPPASPVESDGAGHAQVGTEIGRMMGFGPRGDGS